MKLQGIKVIDLSAFLPGPHFTMMMADHGAEVIKVEPKTGEPTRQFGHRQGAHSVYFASTNRGKKSISIDLKNPAGREALLRLIEGADVVVETYRPGVAKRLGVDYDSVKERAPHIVYCSISAFGQDSPWRDRPAHDLAVLALSGVADLGRAGNGEPAIPGSPPSDMSASLMALSGILMALLRAKETGAGDYIDIAMQDCVLSWLPYVIGSVFAEERAPITSEERLFGGAALYGLYQTSDGGWLALGGSEAKFAVNLLTGLGREDLIDAATQPAGRAQDPVRDYLTETFKSQPLDHWNDWFEGRDICYAPVLDLKQAMDQENIKVREMILRDEAGHKHLGVPIKFRNEPADPSFYLADIGADNTAVLAAAGFDEAEIAELTGSGAIFAAG
jgi:crotonobetainyl-CoA:carnitine CoA-transferase CaiB-like acyl-CoA transferase